MKFNLLATASLVVGTLAFPVHAVETALDKAPGKWALEHYDADKDGKLSETEHKAWEADVLKKYDKDKNGTLSDEEKEAYNADSMKKGKGKGKEKKAE